MDDERFDALSRMLGNGTSRRGALGLLAGMAGVGLGEAVAKRRKHGKGKGKGQATAGNKRQKVTICHRTGSATNAFVTLDVDESAVPAHQALGDAIDPDFQHDIQHCGSCGNGCTGGDACHAPSCQAGTCGTTPTPGVPCDGGAGTCDASGQCQPNTPNVCSGKNSPNPCFERDASTCNAGGTCNCGTGLDGNLTCYENAYCNNGGPECASNADCEAILGRPGSVCFSAEFCCLSKTGCTTPCPSPSA